MSIYYNHAQKYPLQHPPRNRSPQEDVSRRERGRSPPGESFRGNAGNAGMGRRDIGDREQMRRQPHLEDWQDIGNIQQPPIPSSSPKKHTQKQANNPTPKKSPPKEGLKQKLSTIINAIQQQKSVAEITHFHAESDHDDQLQQSTSTIQSNDRRKHASLPRRQDRSPLLGQERIRERKNREGVGQKIGERDEFALNPKPKQENKSRPKYLFYKKVEEQLDNTQNKHQFARPKEQAQYQAEIQQAIQVEKLPDYQYVKDVHPPKQQKKTRLKNKLGFIVDLFQKEEEAASVSYYSESHQSHKQSMEIKPEKQSPQTLPQKKQEKQAIMQNVFEHSPRQAEDYEPQEIPKPRSRVLINTTVNKSAQFEDIKIPVSPIQKIQETPVPTIATEKKQSVRQREQPKEIVPTESAFLKIKKSIKINNSLQRIQLQMSQINRNRSKSKLSATKSVEHNPKPQRYKDAADNDLQDVEMRGKKKSMDERHLSRHIQKSINKQSSSGPSNDYQEQLSKSKSAQSKFSIKLMEMQLKKSAQRQAKSISDQQPVSPQAASRKKSQQKPFQDELTVKKAFPIARKESLPKNNPNYSKYMKINFKDSSESHDNDVMADEIPSIVIKKTEQVQRPKPNESPRRQTIKISSNVNTGQDTTKISLKPVNKVEFSIDRAKRFKTEQIQQQKEDLSQQEKKFLALLKKREEALLKRVKEQVLNNNPSTIIRDNIEQRSKGLSNDTFEKIVIKDESSSSKSPKNYYQAQRREKMSLKSQQPKDAEVRAFFPTLNLSPSKQPQYETFYNGSALKRNSPRINYITSKKKGLSEPISSDSEMSKTLEDRIEDIRHIRREPSKIGYYNIKKLHKESSLNERNFSSKEKYERLRQLLQKI